MNKGLKIFLLIIAIYLILQGIFNIVVAVEYPEWEISEYQKLFNKPAPSNIKTIMLVSGSISIVIGLILFLTSLK